MKNFLFWQRWLFVSALLVTSFGLFMVFFNATTLYDIMINNQYELVFWGSGVVPANARLFQQWVYGAWGATIAGWGVMVAFIAAYPFKRRERWAWVGLAAALSIWYVLDTSISLLYRVNVNVVLNTVLGVLVFLPLFSTRKDFYGK